MGSPGSVNPSLQSSVKSSWAVWSNVPARVRFCGATAAFPLGQPAGTATLSPALQGSADTWWGLEQAYPCSHGRSWKCTHPFCYAHASTFAGPAGISHSLALTHWPLGEQKKPARGALQVCCWRGSCPAREGLDAGCGQQSCMIFNICTLRQFKQAFEPTYLLIIV